MTKICKAHCFDFSLLVIIFIFLAELDMWVFSLSKGSKEWVNADLLSVLGQRKELLGAQHLTKQGVRKGSRHHTDPPALCPNPVTSLRNVNANWGVLCVKIHIESGTWSISDLFLWHQLIYFQDCCGEELLGPKIQKRSDLESIIVTLFLHWTLESHLKSWFRFLVEEPWNKALNNRGTAFAIMHLSWIMGPGLRRTTFIKTSFK